MITKTLHIWQFLVEFGIEVAAAVLFGIVMFVLRFNRRIVEQYYSHIIAKRWDRMAQVNAILSDLANELEVLYVHLIKYHNGDGIPSGTKVTRLTILWEEIGRKIKTEAGDWVLPKRVKPEWQCSFVTGEWVEIVNNTLQHKGKVRTTHYYQIDELKATWDMYGIKSYHEVYIRSKSYGFFTLGISTVQDHNLTEAEKQRIAKAAGQIRELV
jgi:hypothetical protein